MVNDYLESYLRCILLSVPLPYLLVLSLLEVLTLEFLLGIPIPPFLLLFLYSADLFLKGIEGDLILSFFGNLIGNSCSIFLFGVLDLTVGGLFLKCSIVYRSYLVGGL